jgi:hypothetical protein
VVVDGGVAEERGRTASVVVVGADDVVVGAEVVVAGRVEVVAGKGGSTCPKEEDVDCGAPGTERESPPSRR